MADKDKQKNKEETVPVQMVIELLQTQNRMIGALTQTISTQLRMMSADVEMCKVHLGRLVKYGPAELRQESTGSSSSQAPTFPSSPGGPGGAIPTGGEG